MTEDGRKDEMFSTLGKHWRWVTGITNMPGLTQSQNYYLAKAVRGRSLPIQTASFGFQCHMELTLDVVERLIAHSQKDHRAVQQNIVR